MPDKVLIIYDCPMKQCDKLWIKQELEKRGYYVKTVFSFHKISNIEQRGKIGKVLSRLITLWQCMKGITISRKGETVICWSQWSGLFFNMLPGAKSRKIISYNWLTPIPNNKTRFLYVKALQNPKLTAIINSLETKEQIIYDYGVEDSGNIVYIPDVFDDQERFLSPGYDGKEKYCFSGGRANRDWKLLMEIAELCPNIVFFAAAVKADWDDKLQVPENVMLYFDIDPKKYYDLLKNSYMSIYPLKENRVSGLINILKSIQMGKIVLTTNISFTKIYFPQDSEDYLIKFGDVQKWKTAIGEVWNYDKEKYESQVTKMQEYIKEHFSPHAAAERIDSIIKAGLKADL